MEEMCKVPMSIKIAKIIYKTICIIFRIVLALILVIAVILVVQTFVNKDEIPTVMGVKVLQVVSESMEDTLNINDVIIAKQVNVQELKAGDIIVFKKDGAVVTHRITNIVKRYDKLEFETKGDANNSADEGVVSEDNIKGKYVCKIKYLGNVLNFLKTPLGLTIVVTIPVLVMLYTVMRERRITEIKAIRREKRLKYDLGMQKNDE